MIQYTGRAMRKLVFRHMRTMKAQISLWIRAVWSGPSLSAYRIIDMIKCINEQQRPGWYSALAQDDLILRILRMLEGTFSLVQ